MDDLNVVDGFTETFLTFIDSGFGLLGPDVGFLIRVLVTIDIVLAGLTWAMTAEGDVFAGLLRKVLYVGAFALILNNYAVLADIIFASFIDLGLAASGAALRPDDLLRPGFVANTGITAAHPILLDIQTLIGFPEIVVNAVEIAILLLAWLGVVAAFFVLAVQMFVTLVEFKLMALAGFVLVPFALWRRTTFLAERVLGSVMASGVKVMVLAVIIGIGSTIFADVANALQGQEVSIARALPLLLAALSLLGIGIHGPAVASGLIAGGPQLDAGAAAATGRRAGALLTGAAGMAAGGAAAIQRTASAARSAARLPSRSPEAPGTRERRGSGTTAHGSARAADMGPTTGDQDRFTFDRDQGEDRP